MGDKTTYFTFYKKMKDVDYRTDFAFYILVCARIVLTIFGMWIQYRLYKRARSLELMGLYGKKSNFLPAEAEEGEPQFNEDKFDFGA